MSIYEKSWGFGLKLLENEGFSVEIVEGWILESMSALEVQVFDKEWNEVKWEEEWRKNDLNWNCAQGVGQLADSWPNYCLLQF